MNIPGFTAQASLDTSHTGHDRGVAPRGHATDVVTPAGSPCCSVCFKACAANPNGGLCLGCKQVGCNYRC